MRQSTQRGSRSLCFVIVPGSRFVSLKVIALDQIFNSLFDYTSIWLEKNRQALGYLHDELLMCQMIASLHDTYHTRLNGKFSVLLHIVVHFLHLFLIRLHHEQRDRDT